MKAKIIIWSIVSAIVVLTAILFLGVFRLNEQNIVRVGEVSATDEQIVNASTLKKGDYVFMLDKDKATASIEKQIPNIKVVQIKTTSVKTVEIVVRERAKVFYKSVNNNYYLMDEELKVLGISTNIEDVVGLIKIEETEQSKILSIDEHTMITDFVGGDNTEIFYNLYISLYRTATKIVDGEKVYLTKPEINDLIYSVEMQTGDTLQESYKRLIIKTNAGVTFDISKVETGLLEKINKCITAYSSGNYDTTKGVIKIFYHADGTEDFDYFE